MKNLENTKEIVEKFEKKYRDEKIRRIKVSQQLEKKGKEFDQGELPARYMAKYCIDVLWQPLDTKFNNYTNK